MPTLVQLWQTSDGKTFPTEAEAKNYERTADLVRLLESYPGNPLGPLCLDLAVFIQRYYDLVKKPGKRSRQGAPGGGGTPPAEGAL